METLEQGQQIIVDELAAKVCRNQVYYDCWDSAMLLKVEAVVGVGRGCGGYANENCVRRQLHTKSSNEEMH